MRLARAGRRAATAEGARLDEPDTPPLRPVAWGGGGATTSAMAAASTTSGTAAAVASAGSRGVTL